MDAIHQCNSSKNNNKHKGKGQDQCSQSHHQSQSHKPGSCNNYGSSHPPRKCKAYRKEHFHCHKEGHFSQFCHSKQCGKSPGSRNSSNNNRYSCHDVQEIDKTQFDDSVQFEQDSIKIQFKTQMQHANVMFDEISSLQRVPTDVHIKAEELVSPTG